MNLFQVIILPLLAPLCLGWTFSTGVDLAWPPLGNEGYITIDSKVVGDDRPLFPCSNEILTGNEPRVIFPVTGGQLQWNLTNSTGELSDYYFVINIYLAQISADTSEFHNHTAHVDNKVWKNFTTGKECGGESINAMSMINQALETNYDDADIAGMNATFGLRSVLFSSNLFYPYPPDIANVEEMYQCGYVTFVADDTPKADFGGICLDAISSTSSTIRPTVAPSTARSPTPTHNPTTAARTVVTSASGPSSTTASSPGTTAPSTLVPTLEGTTESHKTKARTIGIGIGVSVGVSWILLIIGFLLFRRRRKHGGTLAFNFWVHGQADRGDTEKKLKKGKDVESSSNSVHSEPLPAYTGPDEARPAVENLEIASKEELGKS